MAYNLEDVRFIHVGRLAQRTAQWLDNDAVDS